MKPGAKMPVFGDPSLPNHLTPEQIDDLVAFLQTLR
jgi:hypothetical protein